MSSSGERGIEVRVQVPGLGYQHVLGFFSLTEIQALPALIGRHGVNGQDRAAAGMFCCPELPEMPELPGGGVPAYFLVTLS